MRQRPEVGPASAPECKCVVIQKLELLFHASPASSTSAERRAGRGVRFRSHRLDADCFGPGFRPGRRPDIQRERTLAGARGRAERVLASDRRAGVRRWRRDRRHQFARRGRQIDGRPGPEPDACGLFARSHAHRQRRLRDPSCHQPSRRPGHPAHGAGGSQR